MTALRRIACTSALCFAVTLGTASASPLDGFMAKVRADSGDPYRHHIVGTLTSTTGESDVETTVDQGGLQYVVRNCRDGVCTGSYFDGSRTYALDPNDTPLGDGPADDPFERSVRTISSYAFASPDFEREGGKLTDRGVRRYGGALLRAIEVLPRGGTALIALIDLRTGLLFAVASIDERQSYEYRDYHNVDGVMLPFEVWAGRKRVTQYASRSIATGPFHPPTGLVPVFSGAPRALRLERGTPLPIFTCTIAAHTVPCLLDSGSFSMAMSLELSERLNLDLVGSLRVSGIGSYVTGYVRGPELHVGPATFPPALYVVLNDLHRVGCDLVLGTDILANSTAVLDYERRELTLMPRESAFEGTPLALSFENFVPVVDVRLGDVPARLAIDTGDQANVNVANSFYQAHTTLFKPTETRSVYGIGGGSEQVVGVIPSVTLANFRVEKQPIGATRTGQPTAQGHLGSGFLSHFTLFFDYARNRLGLIPRKGDGAIKPAT